MAWFKFDQNNSGGVFYNKKNDGIGPVVWIEAPNSYQANERALQIGLYFDGVHSGIDCPCCGDRWYEAFGEGTPTVEIKETFDFYWGDKVYAHPANGHFLIFEKSKSSDESI